MAEQRKPFYRNRWLLAGLVILVCGGGYLGWLKFGEHGLPEGIAAGNGRIEATEIDIAAKTPGRIKDILVKDGDFVEAGQVLAVMDTDQLEAQRRQYQAQLQRSIVGVNTAQSVVAQREAEEKAAAAVVSQREAEQVAADKRLVRSQQLVKSNAISRQAVEEDLASAHGARASVSAAQAQLAAASAATKAAEAQVVDAKAAVDAAQAQIDSVSADITDSTLKAPVAGRVQFRVAQPGEVLAAGGRVLNFVDLNDVYMTFFLPTAQAGRVAIGANVRLVLDAFPQYVIPATVTFVANVAQFTPKAVETSDERQKLMFRVKAHIDPVLLQKYITQVKTGLPGMAYVQLDPQAHWPSSLKGTLLQ